MKSNFLSLKNKFLLAIVQHLRNQKKRRMGGVPCLKGGVPNLPNLKILIAIILPILEKIEKNFGREAPKNGIGCAILEFFSIFSGKIDSQKCNKKLKLGFTRLTFFSGKCFRRVVAESVPENYFP